MAYSVQVFSKKWKTDRGSDGNLIRILTHPTDISVRRDINSPEQISFRVPRGGDDATALEIGRIVRVRDGNTLVGSGVIVGPLDKTLSMIPVTVIGKAEILNWSITPYEFELQGNTAEEQVRELLKTYRFFRQNTPAHFNTGTLTDTEVLTVAGDTDEYFVTLDETNEVYTASGTYISQPILCTNDTFGDPENINRLRYLAELGNDTAITVAFRHSNDAATGTPTNWSSWSSEYNLITENTETLGLTDYSISADFRWIQVRFALSTTDTSITPALQAFEIICEYPPEITAGKINLSGPKLNKAFSFASHHQAIREIVSARNAEFRVTDDYELEIAKQFGAKTATQTFEVGKNCNVVRYEQQDRRLSTEIWALGDGRGLAQELVSVDKDNTAIEKYGNRPWIYRPQATTEEQRTQEIADELALRDTPTLQVTLDELATTPLSVEIGDNVNFQYSRRNINTILRVIGVRAADPRKGQPRQFILESNEGSFFTEPEPETQEVGTTGLDGKDGRDAPVPWGDVGIENICYRDDTGIGPILPVTATISFSRSQEFRYKLFVRDAANKDITQILINNSSVWFAQTLTRQFKWDGRDAQGNFVETGAYKIVVLRQTVGQAGTTIHGTYPVTLRRQEIERLRSYTFEDTTVKLFDLTAAEIGIVKILEAGDTIGFFDKATEHARATFESASLPKNITPDGNAAQLSVSWILQPKVPFGDVCSIRTTRNVATIRSRFYKFPILYLNPGEIYLLQDVLEYVNDFPLNQYTLSAEKESDTLSQSAIKAVEVVDKSDIQITINADVMKTTHASVLVKATPINGTALEETLEIVISPELDTSELQKRIESNSKNISTHSKSISSNATNIATNTTDITTNSTNISKNASTNAVQSTAISKNASTNVVQSTAISTNAEAIKTNSTAISTNAAAITTNSTNISKNASTNVVQSTAISKNASTNVVQSTAISKNVSTNVVQSTAISKNTSTITATSSTAASRYLINVKAIDKVNSKVNTNSTNISKNASTNVVQSTAISKNASTNVVQSTAISTNVSNIAKKLETVATDSTITGDGTKDSPLHAEIPSTLGITSSQSKQIESNKSNIATNSTNTSKNSTAASTAESNATAASTNASTAVSTATAVSTNVSTNASVNSAQSTAISTNVKNISTTSSEAASRWLINVKAIDKVNSKVNTNSTNISKNASTNVVQSTAISKNTSTNVVQSKAISTNTANIKTNSTNASTAIANASTAVKNASTAQSTANKRATTASVSAVSKNASTALANASTALATANTASTNASTAVKNASTALKNASTAQSTANTKETKTRVTAVSKNASTALVNASTAIKNASTAATNASTALARANTASTNASTAIKNASTASKNASTAQSTANARATTASVSAVSKNASTALANASTALATANTASTNASTAVKNASTTSSTAASRYLINVGAINTVNSRVRTNSTNISKNASTASTAIKNASTASRNASTASANASTASANGATVSRVRQRMAVILKPTTNTSPLYWTQNSRTNQIVININVSAMKTLLGIQ